MAKLNVQATSLDGVLLVEPFSQFRDFRGDYTETYNEAVYHEAGLTDHFVQDDVSFSHKNVLRGIHGDNGTTKLISCLHGTIYVVIVNNDPSSEQYLQWTAHTLTGKDKVQLYIPARFGNSFLTLSDFSIFHYKQTTYYGDFQQFTLKWDDQRLNIDWPVSEPILSARDTSK